MLNKKVDKVDNARLITNDEATKLNSLLGITAVSSDFEVIDGVLSLNVESTNIATKSEVTALSERVGALEEAVAWEDME